MATRLVKYNGGTATYQTCSSPTFLKEGEFYEVVSKDVGECQTNYTLKGVDGYFNSVWFDDVKVGLVIATKPPKVGERFLCYEQLPDGNKYSRTTVLTSRVRSVEQINNKGYKIYTLNSCYIVHII